MECDWNPDLGELKAEWESVPGLSASEKAKGVGADLEAYRTVLLKAYAPFRVLLNELMVRFPEIPRVNEYKRLREVVLFERDWHVAFPRGGNPIHFVSSPVLAPVCDPLKFASPHQKERLASYGVINVYLDLTTGKNVLWNAVRRLKRKHAAEIRRARTDDATVGCILRLPSDEEFEARYSDLELMWRHSDWQPWEKFRTKLRPGYSSDGAAANRKKKLIALLDPRAIGRPWHRVRGRPGPPSEERRAEADNLMKAYASKVPTNSALDPFWPQ